MTFFSIHDIDLTMIAKPHKDIRKAILKSQRCNRNFDLNQSIPEEDIGLLKTAVSQCPSKQNISFYSVHFVFDREVIEKIHDNTKGFGMDPENYQTNSQTLANLLVVFEEAEVITTDKVYKYRNEELKAKDEEKFTEKSKNMLTRDRDQAVGIAAGYLNLTASLLGYVTGCCSCFDYIAVKKILGLKRQPLLLMGIGFKDMSRNRREHHFNKNFIFPSFKKQAIQVNFIEKDQNKRV